MLPSTRSHIIQSLVLGALLALSLYYLADFSLRQTTALVLLWSYFFNLTNNIWKTKLEERSHRRFSVSIQPKWREILFDHGLVRTEHEWQQWLDRIKTAPASEQALLRDGFHFTVLEQDRDLRSQFIFRNDNNVFCEKLDVTQPIPRIEIERPGSTLGPAFAWMNLVWVPSFIASHPTWGGYELSLTTPDCIKSNLLGAEEMPRKLAFLTVLEFHGYKSAPVGWTAGKPWKEREQARRKSLEENGWTRAEKEYEKFSHIEHKYFTVKHGSI
jgi:hypothetical protein